MIWEIALQEDGLHGKDLSKADVSINIYVFMKAQKIGKPVELSCAIGDEFVDGKPYEEIVEQARKCRMGLILKNNMNGGKENAKEKR